MTASQERALPDAHPKQAGPHAGGWRVAFALMCACGWAGNQFSPLLLMYKQRQHLSSATVNVFLGVYVLGLIPAFLLSGWLSDRYGRKRLMTVAAFTAILASATLATGSLNIIGLAVGRMLSGITVGIATSVGSSWIKELSTPPYDPGATEVTGAKRASLAFALGSLVGAAVAGCIAQWGPIPEQLPFLVQIAFTLAALPLLGRAPETVVPGATRDSWRVPSAGHRRFTRVVVLAAPWSFAAAALAYGYLPVLLAGRTGGLGIAFATLLTVITLGSTALVQPLAKRIDSADGARGLVTGLAFIGIGIALAAAAVSRQSITLAILGCLAMGTGLGLGLVSGLLEVQRIAGPDDLAGLTGTFYAISYVGFLTPTLLAALTGWLPPADLILIVSGAVLLGLIGVLASYRRHLPASARSALDPSLPR